jgi:glycosyltransferase involved in cell wall biosynthesis
MRILVVTDARGASGLADYSRLLGMALAERGHELLPGDANEADAAVYSYAPYAAGVSLGWLRGVRTAVRLRRRARRLVVVFHEVFERPDGRLRMRLLTVLQRWATRRLDALADVAVVADRARARRFAELCPDAAAPETIPVGPNIPVPASARRAAGATIVAFGLLHPDRDIETVVRAVSSLQRQRPDVRLRIVGDLSDDPARSERLRNLIAELGAPAAVEGFLEAEAVAAIFAEAGAFASTYTRSVSLGSGTLAAALAFALPIVVYEDVELHEALVPGETVLTAPREPGALAEMLRDALGERGRFVGARGRQVYKAELAWARIAASFEPLLRGTAASASPTKRK